MSDWSEGAVLGLVLSVKIISHPHQDYPQKALSVAAGRVLGP